MGTKQDGNLESGNMYKLGRLELLFELGPLFPITHHRTKGVRLVNVSELYIKITKPTAS